MTARHLGTRVMHYAFLHATPPIRRQVADFPCPVGLAGADSGCGHRQRHRPAGCNMTTPTAPRPGSRALISPIALGDEKKSPPGASRMVLTDERGRRMVLVELRWPASSART